jgi:hypothetical protein
MELERLTRPEQPHSSGHVSIPSWFSLQNFVTAFSLFSAVVMAIFTLGGRAQEAQAALAQHEQSVRELQQEVRELNERLNTRTVTRGEFDDLRHDVSDIRTFLMGRQGR